MVSCGAACPLPQGAADCALARPKPAPTPSGTGFSFISLSRLPYLERPHLLPIDPVGIGEPGVFGWYRADAFGQSLGSYPISLSLFQPGKVLLPAPNCHVRRWIVVQPAARCLIGWAMATQKPLSVNGISV